MSTFRKTLKVIGNVLFVVSAVLLVIITIVGIMMQVGSDGRMTFGNYSFARVASGSMEPDIPTGSFILVERVDPQTLVVGDMVSFWSDDPKVPQGFPVVHKIVGIEESSIGNRSFITKGTANQFEDEYPVYADSVIGRVTWQSQFIGAVIGIAQAPYMYPILIGILAISLVFNVITVIKEAKLVSDRSNEIAVAAVREATLRELQTSDDVCAEHPLEDACEESEES